MPNQQISGTVQDVETTSRIEELVLDLPESHQINTQRNQSDLSTRCTRHWNYQGVVRQKNACGEESATREKLYY